MQKLWNQRRRFQSTLSVRRATVPVPVPDKKEEISIHALRKESDLLKWMPLTLTADFNPRSP
ncbi:hypothetical protein BIFADO_02337 [Bifidobacterium adolescentis L2-32]|uniref:Uncharacterized protein n=1 Tax=Bifidobacterium adolescentis L2-32 TaxID=411481 RepID=A7A8Z4_BIFAD|nr:hypothetical protein BIFADO_02337 [Bifidobacterium adolescentis L2-32]